MDRPPRRRGSPTDQATRGDATPSSRQRRFGPLPDMSQVDKPQVDMPQLDIPQVDMPQVPIGEVLDALQVLANRHRRSAATDPPPPLPDDIVPADEWDEPRCP